MRPYAKRRISGKALLLHLAAILIVISFYYDMTYAGRVIKKIYLQPDKTNFKIGLAMIAAGSDSVFCSGSLLTRGVDYSLNSRTGVLALKSVPDCDSLTVVAFELPGWLTESAGNRVPEGKRLLQIDTLMKTPLRRSMGPQKQISLSGNKSFSFTVGRSGAGQFSQGLNLDFDARMADNLRLRGSVSDRIGGAGGALSGGGGTSILSELDKYFFEIEGKRFLARGGDIETSVSRFLPTKRIRGMSAAYRDDYLGIATDIGRPAGKFVSQRLRGEDGRQGPYQVTGSNGRPTGIVPGSEKVYVDGQRLEGGSDKHYTVDYPAGRITFSPLILITSRSRIEIDFEAAENDYEQAVYDLAGSLRLTSEKVRFEMGARRETDEKDRPRFGSFSPDEIAILDAAGDSSTQAYRSGVRADTAGSYILVNDTISGDHYEYVGSGGGDYFISFSYVGEDLGDYRYLGDGVYNYVGVGEGSYKPIVFLQLPVRNDYLFGALDVALYGNGNLQLSYQGNVRDNNLFSTQDDNDNFNSQMEASFVHRDSMLMSRFDFRFREEAYNPVSRLNLPDFDRIWALPTGKMAGDESRLETQGALAVAGNRLSAGFGYISYKDNLESKRITLNVRALENSAVSPRAAYTGGNSRRKEDQGGDGLFEKTNAGAAIKVIKRLRLEIDFDRELAKDRFGATPEVEKYEQYRSSAFYRNTVLTVSRRTDFESAELGIKGPRLDKIELISDESMGRLKIRLAGTVLEQASLDSDRGDRSERLYQISVHYAATGGWITAQADYRQNRRSVRTTGDLYLLVGSGEGDYRLEDGQYLFDSDGDYIRIREETGEFTSVSAGEKSHNITFYPGRWKAIGSARTWLSQVAIRLRTEVIEELPGEDLRRISWILPWTSRSNVDYLLRSRREGYSALLFPSLNFYILNFSYSNHFTEQEAGGQLNRSRKEYKTELKNSLSPLVRSTLNWRHRRNTETGVGLVTLALRENEISTGLIINQGYLQMTPRISFVRFYDDFSGGEGRGVKIGNESVFRQSGRGEVRFDFEIRSLTEKMAFSQPEYLVTGGNRFGKSAVINLIGNYDIGKSMRLTVNLTDRIFEGRSAEFTGRGELIARF